MAHCWPCSITLFHPGGICKRFNLFFVHQTTSCHGGRYRHLDSRALALEVWVEAPNRGSAGRFRCRARQAHRASSLRCPDRAASKASSSVRMWHWRARFTSGWAAKTRGKELPAWARAGRWKGGQRTCTIVSIAVRWRSGMCCTHSFLGSSVCTHRKDESAACHCLSM